jgi:hypothetical protein
MAISKIPSMRPALSPPWLITHATSTVTISSLAKRPMFFLEPVDKTITLTYLVFLYLTLL